MLKNYIKIAFRNLRRNPGYSFINIVGLAVGMVCCLLILLFVRDEISYDRFHDNADRIYRILSVWDDLSLPATNPQFVRHLKADYPEFTIAQLTTMTQFTRNDVLIRDEDRQFRESDILFTTPEFFDVFTFDMVQGNGKSALAEPYTALLSETTARRYFGDEEPVGKTLTVNNQIELTVSGVVADAPQNSHFHFSVLVSWATLEAFNYSDSRGNNSIYTYLLLPEGYDPATLEAQFPDFIERHTGGNWYGLELSLQALTDIHLRSNHGEELSPNGQIAYVYIFSAIALFILLVACINFMNLATARSAERAKEVGIRKVAGARRSQLVVQLLAESILLSLLALLLAIVLMAVALPEFRVLSGKPLDMSIMTDGPVIAGFLMIALGVGVLAGSYPAFFLSAFQPITVLKGRLASGKQGAGLRRGLVAFQFATSVFLIVGTAVVYSQLTYLQNANLGFAQDQVVSIAIEDDSIWDRYPAFQNAVLQIPGIAQVTASSHTLPGEVLSSDAITLAGAALEGEGNLITRSVSVGHGFFETLGTQMISGRSFSLDFSTDSSGFVLNETAAHQLMAHYTDQIPSLDQAVGMELRRGEQQGPLLGIVSDFNMSTLHEAIKPTVFFIGPDRYHYYLLRIGTDNLRDTIASLETTWDSVYPEWPLIYNFVDEAFDDMYRTEERLAQIFTIFACLAIFIACLGLFGLAAYTAEQRTKEIGVRKVLGASVAGIVTLLSKDFLKLVLIGFAIAVPIAWIAMNRWLEDFAYRIEIGPGVFVLAGLAAILTALATVSWQSVRAAMMNPVESLRSE